VRLGKSHRLSHAEPRVNFRVTRFGRNSREETMINRRTLLAMLAAIGSGAAAAGGASAQTYPSRPIKIIVPFLAGGTVDIVARQIGQQLSPLLGQPVVIDNRPGGGTTIALKAVATSEPDGHALLLGSTGSLTINPILFKNIEFPGIRNLVPVGMIVTTTNLFAVRSALPVNSIAELVAYAKANPGKLNHGASLGVPPHLLGEFVRARTGIEMPYVPYRSTAAAIPDFLSGQIQATSESSSVMLPHIQAGAARALVVAGTRRLPELPNVPTLVEAGLIGYPDEVWMGLVAPQGTPAPVVDKLNAALNEALKSPETQSMFRRIGFATRPGSAQEFAARITGDSDKWAAVIKLTGVKID
jgi:tripartite-type tricarboxylate transporter receptor subunit TctC